MRANAKMSYVVVLVWIILTTSGFFVLWRYESTPGPDGGTGEYANTRGSFQPERTDKQTLLFFAHPRCPCTKASLNELERLVANCDGRLHIEVFFFNPATEEMQWSQTELWKQAVRIPGVTVTRDAGGEMAARFGATTSGHAILLDTAGDVLFTGGITASRGHEGDNLGRSSIESLVHSGDATQRTTPTFGCTLFDADQEWGDGGENCNVD